MSCKISWRRLLHNTLIPEHKRECMDLHWLLWERADIAAYISELVQKETRIIIDDDLPTPNAHLRHLEHLLNTTPKVARGAVNGFFVRRDERAAEFSVQYPRTVDVLWQTYRRGGAIGNPHLTADRALIHTMLNNNEAGYKPPKEVESAFWQVAKSDDFIAKEIQEVFFDAVTGAEEPDDCFPLNKEPPYQLVGQQTDRLLMVPRYFFLDWRDMLRESLYDLRLHALPKFTAAHPGKSP